MTDEKEEKARKTFEGITEVLDDLAKGAGEEAAKSTDFPTEKVEEVLKGMARAMDKEEAEEPKEDDGSVAREVKEMMRDAFEGNLNKATSEPKEEEQSPIVELTDVLRDLLGKKPPEITPEMTAFCDDITDALKEHTEKLDEEDRPVVAVVVQFNNGHRFRASNVCHQHTASMFLKAANDLVIEHLVNKEAKEKPQEESS